MCAPAQPLGSVWLKNPGEAEEAWISDQGGEQPSLVVSELRLPLSAVVLEVGAAAQSPLDREAEAVIEQPEPLVSLVIAELTGVAVLVADQGVEEAGGQRVVGDLVLSRPSL